MRKLKTNSIITILGYKVSNTYLKAENGKTYPLTDTKFLKGYHDYETFWWQIKRHYFQWRVLKVIGMDKN